MIKVIRLNTKQKLSVIIVITVFIMSIILSLNNIFKINKIQADITSLNIKKNIVILNVNSTKQKLINKIGSIISVKSNNIEISNNTKIKTGDVLRYNNTDYPIAILGDVNKDGIISGSDVSQIYSKYKNKISFNEVQTVAADVNGDGSITGSDVSGAYSLYKNPPIETDDQETYTITLDSNNATTNGSSTTTVKYGDTKLSSITNPQKKVTITYVNNVGATVSGGDAQKSYTLNGWYTQITGGNKVASNSTTPQLEKSVSGYTNSSNKWIKTSNAILYAHWNEVTANLPTITKTGYTCKWSTNFNGTSYVNSGGTWTFSAANDRTFTANCERNDMIHFINVGSSDAILIESKGHYGLIDASTEEGAYSTINYLNKINVNHLDFVLGTHDHWDHIGGIPLIASSGLVNSSTTYIYKKNYDNSGCEYTEGKRQCWGNNVYSKSAIDAMKYNGAKLLETTSLSNLDSINANFVNNSDIYKRYISFNLGNYEIKVYNLYNNDFTVNGVATTDENTNSLVTLITTSAGKKVLSMGDMNVRDAFEQYYGSIIGKVDVLKASHHGYHYSNSKNLLDSTKPSYVIIPNNIDVANSISDELSSNIPYLYSSVSEFGAPRLYLKQMGSKVYQIGNCYDACVVSIDGSNISVNDSNGYELSDTYEVTSNVKDGWHIWFNDDDRSFLYYIRNNQFVKNEFINGYWLRSDGTWDEAQQSKWYKNSSGWWYGYSDQSWYAKNNYYYIDGKMYYFDSNGYCTSDGC